MTELLYFLAYALIALIATGMIEPMLIRLTHTTPETY